MPVNHVLLETIELTQSAASVTFDNIPQTGYTDLKIVISGRGTRAEVQSNWLVSFNGSTAADYSARVVEGTGTGSSTFNYARFIGSVPAASATASIFGNIELLIPNYTSNKYKSYSSDAVTEHNSSLAFVHFVAGIWAITSAISSITISSDSSDNFLANSTFSLYGIAATGTTPTIAPKAQGGNIVANDGTYWYHAFLSSGTFTPTIPLTCDYLVIAGGGGGGRDWFAGGGGGAGGLRSTVTATGGGGSLESALSLISQSYSVTVGAGGSGGGVGGGGNGTDSTFSTITSTGGGGGGGNNNDGSSSGVGVAGKTGGSGGGGGSFGASGARTVGQGFAGGSSSSEGGAGGGGAGVAGSSTSSGNGANGGNGVLISSFSTATSTGVSGYYAGGGAGAGNARTFGPVGATGGLGGGGNSPGQAGTGQTDAIASTGSGGYGGNGNRGPGSGASGIVIIRYAMA
jgi:hypothetical protein